MVHLRSRQMPAPSCPGGRSLERGVPADPSALQAYGGGCKIPTTGLKTLLHVILSFWLEVIRIGMPPENVPDTGVVPTVMRQGALLGIWAVWGPHTRAPPSHNKPCRLSQSARIMMVWESRMILKVHVRQHFPILILTAALYSEALGLSGPAGAGRTDVDAVSRRGQVLVKSVRDLGRIGAKAIRQ